MALSAREPSRKSRSLFYPSGPITARHTKGREWLLDAKQDTMSTVWCKSGPPTSEPRISSVPSTRGEVLPALIVHDSERAARKAMLNLRRDLNGLLDPSKDGSNGQLSAVASLLTPGAKPGGQQKAAKAPDPDTLSDDELWESIGRTGGAGQRFKYIKFTPLATRSEEADAVQLGQIHFKSSGSVVSLSGAAATNPRGSNPPHGKPGNAIDGCSNSKWIESKQERRIDTSVSSKVVTYSEMCTSIRDQKLTEEELLARWNTLQKADHTLKGKLVVTFDSPTHVDEFSFTTAIDNPERDPTSWRLEGSVDYVSWVVLHEQTEFAAPAARKTPTTWFKISQVSRSDLKSTAIAKLNARRSHDDAKGILSAR